MTNNLIPEQRPDKNGKISTRWVRQDKPASSTPMPPPWVVKVKAEEREALRKEVIRAVWEARLENSDDPLPFLEKASDETIALIHENLVTDPDNSENISAWEFSWMASIAVDEQTFVEYIHLYPHHRSLEDTEVSLYTVRGIHSSERNRAPLDMSDPESVLRNVAMLRATVAIQTGDDSDVHDSLIDFDRLEHCKRLAHFFKDDRIANLVCDHPERVDELISVIADRGVAGIEMFAASINEAPDPLMNGRL